MAFELYNAGLDALATWETGDFRWVLCTAGSFNRDQVTVAAVLGGGAEVTVTGYSRQATSSPTRTVDNATDRITYAADDPVFGSLDPGEIVTAVLLYQHVTTDSDSVPIGLSTLTPTATDAIDPFTLTITDGIVAYLDQAA